MLGPRLDVLPNFGTRTECTDPGVGSFVSDGRFSKIIVFFRVTESKPLKVWTLLTLYGCIHEGWWFDGPTVVFRGIAGVAPGVGRAVGTLTFFDPNYSSGHPWSIFACVPLSPRVSFYLLEVPVK